MSKKIKPDRLYYLDYLRVFSTIAVIVLHAASQKWSSVDVESAQWMTMNVYDSLVRWCVPVFVMISGALFLDNDKQITIKDIYHKYILRIATAFLFWSIVYAIYNCSIAKSFDDIVYKIMGGYYHMWYLFMIAGLYMITPLLREITRSKRLTEYFIILGLIFTFVIPRLVGVLDAFNQPQLETLVSTLSQIKIKFYFNFTLGYTLYYVLGYYLSKYSLGKSVKNLIYIMGPVSFALIIYMTAWYSKETSKAEGYFYDNLSVNVLIISVFVFLVAKNVFSKKKPKHLSVLLKLSKYSFGVYLVHYLVLNVINFHFHFNATTISPIISIPVLTIIVFVISLIISVIFNHIPLLKKYIV